MKESKLHLRLIAAMLLGLAAVTLQGKKGSTIKIVDVPAYDEKGGADHVGTIKGTVSGMADCKDCKVVIFARTNAWWVQPVADAPYTQIVGGKWESETHLGTRYAAVLAHAPYKAPATVDKLPDIDGVVVAVDQKPG